MDQIHYQLHIATNQIPTDKHIQQIIRQKQGIGNNNNQQIRERQQLNNNIQDRTILTKLFSRTGNLYNLHLPVIPLLFIYETQFFNKTNEDETTIIIDVQFQDFQKKRKFRTKEIKNMHRRRSTISVPNQENQSNKYAYIYKILQLQMSDGYDTDIIMSVTIKYTNAYQKKQQRFANIAQLNKSLSRREFRVFGDEVYSVIKKNIIIQKPVKIEYRYNSQVGYIWLKITNASLCNSKVIIHKLQMMNWLAYQYEKIKKFKSQMHPNFISDGSKGIKGYILKQNQSIGVMMTLPKNLKKVEIPICLEYSYPYLHESVYKMITPISI